MATRTPPFTFGTRRHASLRRDRSSVTAGSPHRRPSSARLRSLTNWLTPYARYFLLHGRIGAGNGRPAQDLVRVHAARGPGALAGTEAGRPVDPRGRGVIRVAHRVARTPAPGAERAPQARPQP
ncbi:hypothetical protein GCM10010349_08080 [Streptomyces flavofungini]|nr:hypothetical protein GCM10010349_08080 [Streptomyces flavofungini]